MFTYKLTMSDLQYWSARRYTQQLFFLFCLPLISWAQNNEDPSIRFHHITPDESFGMGSVWSILEDHEGFMWFGTEYGLIKYDGYELTPYRQSNIGGNSTRRNIVVCLYEDSKNNLWMGSYGGGLTLYRKAENKFYNFSHDAGNPNSLPFDAVKTIIEDKQGVLWFGTEGGGIATIDVDSVDSKLPQLTFNVIKHDPKNPKSLSSNFVQSIAEDRKTGDIYVGTHGGGVNIIDSQRSTITHLLHDQTDPNTLGDSVVYEVFVDSKRRVWIGTQDAGIDLYLPDTKSFFHYPSSGKPTSLFNNEVETITEDKAGTIWVGTDNGLSKLVDSNRPVPEHNFQTFQHVPQDESSILSNIIKIVYVDSKNSLWVGSYYGGVNVYNENYFKFLPIRNKPWKKNSLSGNNVTALVEDEHGNLWIGTDGGGLNLFTHAFDNIQSDNYKVIELINPFTKEVQNKIKSLALDHKGNLWIGTWGSGMFRFDPTTGRSTYFGQDDPSQSFDAYSVLTIKVDQDNNVWAGSLVNGLSFYNRKDNSFTTYRAEPNTPGKLSSDRINTILVDSKNRVWIGGETGGLNLYNREDDSFIRINYKDILNMHTSILSLMEAHDGKIWIGTLWGAIAYDPQSKIAVAYNDLNGAQDNVIHAMLEDDEGRVWMSTNLGMLAFDQAKDSVLGFTKQDGLQGNQFNHNSAYRCSNGLMLFGGTNGWNAFYPKEINKRKQQYPIALTKLWLNGELMEVNSPGSPLDAPLNDIHTLQFSYHQNSFGLEFAALEYNFTNQSKYAYILEGFNDKWQYIGSDRKVSFTNLFPREYTLRIKATNKDGLWSERSHPLKIIVRPAWWQTNGFKIGLIGFITALAIAIHKIRIRILVTRQKKLEKIVKVRTAALSDSNQMLQSKIGEINSINELLSKQRNEIMEMNKEILSQNEELTSQNLQIVDQQESLKAAQQRLKEVNEKLEKLVDERTAELQYAIKKLNKTVHELDRFIYSASHDLSAPLKSVRGLVQLAKMEKKPEMIAEYYHYINESILKLEVVVESLVEYSKNVHLDPKISPINLPELVDEVWEEIAFWPAAARVKYHLNMKKNQIVQCDKYRLRIVLHNLISNGIKYADIRKEESVINLDYSERNDHWELKIEDNGIGIDEIYLDKVFDMYFRATDRSKGSGLGLFIVKEIINKLGGDIQVNSTIGVKTVFTITLPKQDS